ncbi:MULTISPECIES: flagellin N-terminal helical domain-containing protein [Exiguobacterium]|uniref:flagellin N-terminal helical domain-containing protein n=1 Tax=Exiguobacterium TaxID=33986 RepID=UPI001BE78E9A|nr:MULTISPECIES: flagellin [Exiguobacterium]MCT4775734.1 flagellin [Exiguobacterium aquaticum]MCT4787792.1 flagellin [Exiguobacterium mexicanum]
MIINHNLNSMNAHRNMSFNTTQTGKAMEKLSSGLRINRAGDDAAGLAISEKMRGQIRGLDQASRNSQDAISLIQTAEGALNETHSILQRMRELAVQGSSDTNQDSVDRDALDQEFQQLKSEIDDISSQTKFNKMNLLDGSFGNKVDTDPANTTALAVAGVASIEASGPADTYTFADDGTDLTVTNGAGDSITIAGGTMADGAQSLNISEWGITIQTNSGFVAASLNGTDVVTTAGAGGTFQTGANSGETMNLAIGNMSASGLSINSNDLQDRTNATTALDAVDAAINAVSTERSNLGAKQNRLEHRINNLNVGAENLQAAESRIRDVDMAKEMMNFTKNNILNQAAQAMMSQSNQQPQAVLQLLR